ncbi:TPA: hypothetical protein HA239_05725 [Candidatus Woesearchaeota archaeon]|nr:hypothetical protein QT06_C0001G1223 [archaeon GW2011_AR15]MBS3104312.1 hypothetical protein [Candidatus Woesearchaeota archaeon]HIH41878.1 hypothetical protein [Candidatus Woesearchaeota archaeon]
MIAGLGSDNDIDIFLTSGEIDNLENNILEGTIIKYADTRIQLPLEFGVDEVKSRQGLYLNGFGVHRHDASYQVFMSPEVYSIIKERDYGARYGTLGYKITIISLSRMDNSERQVFENLQFYLGLYGHQKNPSKLL